MKDAYNNPKNIDYGIKRIIKFGNINEKDNESQELKDLEKETEASIVKIETLISTRILLLCTFLFSNFID